MNNQTLATFYWRHLFNNNKFLGTDGHKKCYVFACIVLIKGQKAVHVKDILKALKIENK